MVLRFFGVVLVLLCVDVTPGQTPLRFGTWNVQSLGLPGSAQWTEAVNGADRIDCDVLTLQEVENMEAGDFPVFASQTGYPHSALSTFAGSLSGGLRLGVLSRHPIVSSWSHTSASLSGQPSANDIGRVIFQADVQLPGAATVLGVFVVHLKSGNGGSNDFRRAIELVRLQQAVTLFRAANPGAPYIVSGDFNDDTADSPFAIFNGLPGGLPGSFNLGNDITFPVTYDPFATVTTPSGVIAPATQEDSTSLFSTRPASGRRLDYVVLHGGILNFGDEVYNSVRDNGVDDLPLGNWLAKAGVPLASSSSSTASDHLPVFGDFSLAGGMPPAPASPWIPGDVVVSEYMANPLVVSDTFGEWVELFNTTANPIDLQGFEVRDQGGDSFTLPPLMIPARGRVVLAAVSSAALNGGVTPDFVWPFGSFFLGNGSDEIEVVAPNGTVLDAVLYDGGPNFPDPNGASVERLDVTATAIAANFGIATTPFGAGDFGTPGAANSLDVGAVFTTLSIAGPRTPGTTAFLNIAAPFNQGGKPYILAASLCPAPGIPTGPSGRVIDLCFDDLVVFSATPGNGLFNGFDGSLNVFGLAVAHVAIPNVPALSGTTIHLSGVVLDPLAVEAIASIMDNAVLTVN